MTPPRVCFLSLNAYPTLAGTRDARVGGAEVQQILIARYLSGRGYDVSFVTRDHGQPSPIGVSGVTVHAAFRIDAGVRYLRFIHPRATGIWRALRQADADVYYQRCAAMETGLVAAFCRCYRRRFVFASGSDTDFERDRAIIPNARDRALYTFGLRRADRIVTQTETQRRLLKRNFSRDGLIIPSICPETPASAQADPDRGHVLWVSTLRSWKRPGMFLELARRMPGVEFVMAGGPASGEEALYRAIEQQARLSPNVRFCGFIPFRYIDKYFDECRVFVNTSRSLEGFPNTLLQAWNRGIPVVSTFDPDGIIERYALGYTAADPDTIYRALERTLRDPETYRRMQQNALRYMDTHHRIQEIGPRYEKLLHHLAGR
jgi:glycosyltransferase involved in cell wall biosynthesis